MYQTSYKGVDTKWKLMKQSQKTASSFNYIGFPPKVLQSFSSMECCVPPTAGSPPTQTVSPSSSPTWDTTCGWETSVGLNTPENTGPTTQT